MQAPGDKTAPAARGGVKLAPAEAPIERPPGEGTGASNVVMEGVAGMMQGFKPFRGFKEHVCTWAHRADDPTYQVETHHIVSRINEDVAQCGVFDTDSTDARLLGVEYIVSDRVFSGLPDEEKKLWHSHYYEIKTGLWFMPSVPNSLEHSILKDMARTYGKFWGVWPDRERGKLPLGLPTLMMSPQPEAGPDVLSVASRDGRYDISKEAKAENRKDISGPPGGVHHLSDLWRKGQGWGLGVVEKDLDHGHYGPSFRNRVFH